MSDKVGRDVCGKCKRGHAYLLCRHCNTRLQSRPDCTPNQKCQMHFLMTCSGELLGGAERLKKLRERLVGIPNLRGKHGYGQPEKRLEILLEEEAVELLPCPCGGVALPACALTPERKRFIQTQHPPQRLQHPQPQRIPFPLPQQQLPQQQQHAQQPSPTPLRHPQLLPPFPPIQPSVHSHISAQQPQQAKPKPRPAPQVAQVLQPRKRKQPQQQQQLQQQQEQLQLQQQQLQQQLQQQQEQLQLQQQLQQLLQLQEQLKQQQQRLQQQLQKPLLPPKPPQPPQQQRTPNRVSNTTTPQPSQPHAPPRAQPTGNKQPTGRAAPTTITLEAREVLPPVSALLSRHPSEEIVFHTQQRHSYPKSVTTSPTIYPQQQRQQGNPPPTQNHPLSPPPYQVNGSTTLAPYQHRGEAQDSQQRREVVPEDERRRSPPISPGYFQETLKKILDEEEGDTFELVPTLTQQRQPKDHNDNNKGEAFETEGDERMVIDDREEDGDMEESFHDREEETRELESSSPFSPHLASSIQVLSPASPFTVSDVSTPPLQSFTPSLFLSSVMGDASTPPLQPFTPSHDVSTPPIHVASPPQPKQFVDSPLLESLQEAPTPPEPTSSTTTASSSQEEDEEDIPFIERQPPTTTTRQNMFSFSFLGANTTSPFYNLSSPSSNFTTFITTTPRTTLNTTTTLTTFQQPQRPQQDQLSYALVPVTSEKKIKCTPLPGETPTPEGFGEPIIFVTPLPSSKSLSLPSSSPSSSSSSSSSPSSGFEISPPSFQVMNSPEGKFWLGVRRGQLELIREAYDDLDMIDERRVCERAAQWGQLNVLRWAREEKAMQWCAMVSYWAIRQKNLKVLSYAIKNGCPLDVDKLRRMANPTNQTWIGTALRRIQERQKKANAKKRRRAISVLLWLTSNDFFSTGPVGKSKGGVVSACTLAAREGRLWLVLWLRRCGCEWDEWTCRAAGEEGHWDVVARLRERGCPWHESQWVTFIAANRGEWTTVQWLIGMGCSIDIDRLQWEAKRQQNQQVLALLEEKRKNTTTMPLPIPRTITNENKDEPIF